LVEKSGNVSTVRCRRLWDPTGDLSSGRSLAHRSTEPCLAAFTLPALSVAEARNQHRDLLRRLGAAGDALWIAELGDSLAERNRRAILGVVNAPGEEASASRDSFPFTARAVRMVERV
jgi:hypothetical protein